MKTKPSVLAKVTKEVCHAYNEDTRQLQFKASAPVTIEEAVKIMAKALDCDEDVEGYNNFKPNLLRHLPAGSKVTLAREWSVCVYVTLPKGVAFEDINTSPLNADECDNPEKGIVRVWWD